MLRIFAATAVAALLGLGATQPSAAYTIDGSVNALNQYASPNFVSGKFSDAFSFSLDQRSAVNASFTGNPGTAFTLSDFAIYNGTTKETTAFGSALIFENFEAGTDTVDLGPGSYFIGITGSSSSPRGTYTGTLAISAVPLPPSLVLFGGSIVALGVVGAVWRRTAAVAAKSG